ncbi:STAS domain-containing protein [Albibacterium sp.]|uniref:STAS domain-containing protein n=1 Tax=Albibacterium sp. TaxID=2952885 RepID=UPI002BE66430|nr:STAS domain-containing protein [Albibacterium sp.]HUH18797.1 STAS domain-containing protein [Albibacterium sp.]
MKFTIDRHERYVVLKPHEKVLDGSAAPQVKSEFIRINTDGQRNIVLDLSEVDEVDSSGLRSALMAHRMCKAMGGIFILAHANPAITQLIDICKLDDVLVSVPTIQEAEDIVFMEELEKEFRGSSASEEG